MSNRISIARGSRSVRLATSVIAALAATVFVGSLPASAAEPVGLGTATSFAVLAGSAITNTGPTTITGDVGVHPGTSQTGFDSVTLAGANHGGDSVTQGAKTDLVTAYNDAAGRSPVTTRATELGGATLLGGVYTAESGTFGLTGTLTLDAAGDSSAVFVFKMGTTLTTATDSRVELINGADPCRVVWQVGSSATFGTRTAFVGDVLALTSITANTSATFRGRLLARDGAVTLDTNTITNAACASSVASGGGTTATTAIAATPTSVVGTAADPSTTGGGVPGSTATTRPTPSGSTTATTARTPSGGTSTNAARPPLATTGTVNVDGALRAAVALLGAGSLALYLGRRRLVHGLRR